MKLLNKTWQKLTAGILAVAVAISTAGYFARDLILSWAYPLSKTELVQLDKNIPKADPGEKVSKEKFLTAVDRFVNGTCDNLVIEPKRLVALAAQGKKIEIIEVVGDNNGLDNKRLLIVSRDKERFDPTNPSTYKVELELTKDLQEIKKELLEKMPRDQLPTDGEIYKAVSDALDQATPRIHQKMHAYLEEQGLKDLFPLPSPDDLRRQIKELIEDKIVGIFRRLVEEERKKPNRKADIDDQQGKKEIDDHQDRRPEIRKPGTGRGR